MIKLKDTKLSANDFKISLSVKKYSYDKDKYSPEYAIVNLIINNEYVPWENIISVNMDNDITLDITNKAIEWYINTNLNIIRKIKLQKINDNS